jgi:hypothetical protein
MQLLIRQPELSLNPLGDHVLIRSVLPAEPTAAEVTGRGSELPPQDSVEEMSALSCDHISSLTMKLSRWQTAHGLPIG